MGDLFGLENETRWILLHFVRLVAAFSLLPAFGSGPAARFSKVGLALFLAILVGVADSPEGGWADPGWDAGRLGVAVAGESMVGFMLGWISRFSLEVCRLAGGLISQEMGLNLANQIDPINGHPVPLMGYLFEVLSVILFFAMNAHHALLGALVRSFQGVKPGRFVLDEQLVSSLVGFGGGVIDAALRLAAPVFTALVLLSMMIALMSKVAPQWHILDTSYPIRAGAGLFLVFASLPFVRPLIERVFEMTNDRILIACGAG
jgi:flagellar biosynthetic protein FliR